MKMQSTIDPAALQMLNSLATELDTLEAAAGRIRARLDTLIDFLTPETMDPESAGHKAPANGQYVEELGAEASLRDGTDVPMPVGRGLTSSGDEAFNSAESADVSDADAAVIGLCACIEASVAEFTAAAELARELVDLGDAEKAIPETAALVGDHGHDGEPAAAAEAGVAGGVEAGEAVVATGEPTKLQVADDIAKVAEPVAIDAAASEASADGRAPGEATATVVVLDPKGVASNVVPIKLNRQVWPQLMTACASVLLIAAAAVVVAMPELVGFTI